MKKLASLLLTLIAVIISISCEIGLGASVDTEPPSIEIDAGIVDKTIAGDFEIEGSWSDDGSIEKISAVLMRTDGSGIEIEVSGSIEESAEKRGSGRWKIPVKAESEGITDGSYQATIKITDSVGRVTTQNTTFTIDNTAPVLILTKPNSRPGDETVSAYGQRIFLEGSIADTAKETNITVEFYADETCSGAVLTTISKSNIAPTDVNSNNARIAVYADKEDLEKQYDRIYNPEKPDGKEGSKEVYIKITASDIAGNSTTDFYFSKDLAKDLTKSSGTDAYSLAPIDIYNILNHTDELKKTARAAEDTKRITELLKGHKADIAKISINPENSPYFTVSGMKALTKSGKDFESQDNGYFVINGAQTLEISVFMGSDSIEIADDSADTPAEERSFYVYALECDENCEAVKEDKEENRIKLYSKSKETGIGINKKTYYSIGGKQTHKTTAGAYVFTVPMTRSLRINPDDNTFVTQNLEYGKNYLILVSGKDNEDNPVEPGEATGYGFHFTTSGGAPVLNISEPKDNTVFHKKGDGIVFEGSAKSEEGIPEITVWNGSTKIADIPLNTETDGELNEFSSTIPSSVFSQDESKIYSISIKASRGESLTESKYSVWYDVEGPVIDIMDNAIQPVITANGKDSNINGKLSLNGTIIDKFDQFKRATFRVFQNGTEVEGVRNNNLESSFNFVVDTTKLTDKCPAKFVIEAYDRVENIPTAEDKSKWEKEFYVDQSTDKPVFTNTSSSLDITQGTSESLIEEGKNMFMRGSSLVLGVSDDDSVKEAEVILEKKKDDGSFEEADRNDETKTLYNKYENPSVITHTIPNAVGIYRATVKAYDINYVSEEETPNNMNEVTFMIRVTGTGPDVSITTPDKDYISTLGGNGSIRLHFDVKGVGDRFKLYRNEQALFSGEDAGGKESPFDYILTYTQEELSQIESGEKTADDITFKVTDNQGFTDKVYTPKFDSDLPEVSITKCPPVEADGSTEESSYLFKGAMSDGTSGIKGVSIRFISGDEAALIQAATEASEGWIECTSGSAAWSYEAVWAEIAAFATEGKKTVIVKAEDGSGNIKTAFQSFTYDRMKPQVLSITGQETTRGDDVILSINLMDTNLTVPQVYVKQGTSVLEVELSATQPAANSESYTSTVTIPFAASITADGIYDIEVIAKDANGRSSSAPHKTHRIIRDHEAPAINFTSPASSSDAYIAKSSYKFEGTVTDANEITEAKAMLYKVTESGDTAVGEDSDGDGEVDWEILSPNKDDGGKWSWQVYELEPGTYKLKVTAKDVAGNIKTCESSSVNMDNIRPELVISSSKLTDASGAGVGILTSGTTYYAAKNNYTITVTVNDTNFDYSYIKEDGTGLAEISEESGQDLKKESSAENAFTFSPESYADGLYTYTIKVEDKAGNKSDDVVIKVHRDTTGPSVVIRTPDKDITEAKDALGGDSYAFRINAVDGSGVGVAKLYYVFSKESDISSVAATEWIEVSNFSDGDKNIDIDLIEGTTAVTDSQGKITKLCEGNWNLYAKAMDKSGNVTSLTSETIAKWKRSFPVDKKNPELSVNNLSESGVNPLYAEIQDGGYTISGSASDTNSLDENEAVTVNVDGTDYVLKKSDIGEDGSWSYKIFTGNADGTLKSDEPVVVKVTAKDAAGKTTPKTFTLYYDTKDPDLTVTSPADDEAVAFNVKEIKGTVSDGGYGIRKLEYKLYKESAGENGEAVYTVVTDADGKEVTGSFEYDENGNGSSDGAYPVTIKGEQWYITAEEGKIPLGSEEGALKLEVTATEKTDAQAVSGRQYKNVKTVPFYYDVAKPGLEETLIGTTGKTTNGGTAKKFSLGGRAWDSNELDRIEIECGGKIWTSKVPVPQGKYGGITLEKKTSDPGEENNNWTAEFTAGSANSGADNYIGDGTQEFTITAYDIAGKEYSKTRTVTVDTIKPVINKAEITTQKAPAVTGLNGDWYKTRSLSVEITPEDKKTASETETENGSGVSKVEYQIQESEDSAWSAWAPLSPKDGKYTGSVSFDSDGKSKKIRIKATDVAGNESEETEIELNIDTSAPSLDAKCYRLGTNGELKEARGIIYVQKGTKLTLYGNYADPDSGIKPLTFSSAEPDATGMTITYSTGEVTESSVPEAFAAYETETLLKDAVKSWKAEFVPSISGSISVTGTNRADINSSTVNIADITIDEEPPVFSNEKFEEVRADGSSPVTKSVYQKTSDLNYYTNNTGKTYVISGIATDDVGLSDIKLDVENTASENPKTAISYGKENLAEGASLGKWKFVFTLTDWQTGAIATVTVTDKSGRETPEIYNIVFDKEAPVSDHQIDAKGKDLVFRIGNADNNGVEKSGNKYAGGSFGNDSTIMIRGNFTDNDASGLKAVWYKIYSENETPLFYEGKEYSTDSTEMFETLKADVIANGKSIAPLSATKTQRVYYNVGRKLDDNGNVVLADGNPEPDESQIFEGSTQDTTEPDTEGYYRYYKDIDTIFSESISGFHEGKNYLVLAAEDNAGNTVIDKVTLPIEYEENNETKKEDRTYPCFSLNVDTNPPTIAQPQSMAIKYTNGGTCIITAEVTDEPKAGTTEVAGVKEVKFTFENNGTKEKAAVYNETSGKWKADISSVLPDSGTFTISAVATDAAGTGNQSTRTVATVMIDKTPPIVVLTPPKDADDENSGIRDVNGIIDISGTAEDDRQGGGLSPDENKLLLYYTKSPELGVKKGTNATSGTKISDTDIASESTHTADDHFVQIVAGTNAASWTFSEINVEKPDGSTTLADDTEYYFMAASTDRAGNTGYSDPVKVKINKNSDRPVVRMNNIKKPTEKTTGNYVPEGYLTSTTVNGSVKDDDGTILKLWLWQKKKNGGNAPASYPSKDESGNITVPAGWIEIGSKDSGTTIEDGNWQIESSEGDGQTGWYWTVQDAKGTIFSTLENTDELKRPYAQFKGETAKVDWSHKEIALQYDTESPEINRIELLRLPKTQTLPSASDIEEYMNSQNPKLTWLADDGISFGCEKAILYMKVTVTEKTGMSATTPITIKNGDSIYLNVTSSNISGGSDDGNSVYTYITGPFDMSDSERSSEIVRLNVIAKDGANRTGSREKKIVVDNSADISITKAEPKPESEKSGEFAFQATVSDTLSSVDSIKYYIPPYTTYSNWENKLTDEAKETVLEGISGWTEVTDVSLTFKIEFSGNNNFSNIIGYTTNGAEAVVSSSFRNYDTGLAAANYAADAPESGIYLVPLWFRVKDEVGNTAYITSATYKANASTEETKDIMVKYNPNTDRPTVAITDPEITADGIEKGGNIKIAGTASDNEGISEVYLQFDFGNGEFDNGSLTMTDIPHTGTPPLKGVKANGTRNWHYTFDASGLGNYTDTNQLIRVRAIAIDSDTTDPLVSAWSDVLKIKINNNIPSFENLYIRQREEGSPTGNVKVSREYDASGMFIKGTGWFLEGTAYTSSSDHLTSLEAGSYKWTGNGTSLSADSSNPSSPAGYAEYESVSVNEESKNRKINFRIPVTGETTWSVTLTAKDAKDPTGSASETYTVNIDNTAPSFPDLYEIDNEGVDNKKGIRLYRDSYGLASNLLGDTNFLQNSNGSSFTLAGKIIEEGSGFDKAVFYIKRKGSDGERVYNPMLPKSRGNNTKYNRTNIVDDEDHVSYEGENPKTVYINSDDLPVRNINIENTPADAKLTATEIKDDMNIRTGGLVYIGGLYRTITSVDRTTGFVTINPAYDGNEEKALFVYALVVDHSGEGENSDGSIRNDDGDELLESFSGSQTKNYSWEASFNSANIPDGPVEIHVVTFDEAGNIGHGYTKTYASNNAPRITKLMLGTDLNGNGVFDFGSGEFSTFYAQRDENSNSPLTKSGKKIWGLDTSDCYERSSLWKLKNGAALIPEFVGGQEPFYYMFSHAAAANTDPQKIRENKGELTAEVLNGYKLIDSGNNAKIKFSGTQTNANWSYSTNRVSGEDVTNDGGSLTVTNEQITGEDGPIYLNFTFWDSTEECTPGYDTGYTILNLKVYKNTADSTPPEAYIKPFEWEGTGFKKKVVVTTDETVTSETNDEIDSLGDGETTYTLGTVSSAAAPDGKTVVTTTTVTPKNSLYNASRDNGHIELESDLSVEVKNYEVKSDTTLGEDPKVSGKITFHGTAFDETRLSSLWFKFDSFKAYNGLTQTETTAGETTVTLYDKLSDAQSAALQGYTQAAWYNPSTASWVTPSVAIGTDHWEISVSDTKFDQDGHTVDWYLSIDTAYIDDVVGIDKALSVFALDTAGSASDVSAEQTSKDNNTSCYKMDVVPYVSKFTTSLSSYQSSNPSVYDRTALGHYPVYKTHAQGSGGYEYENIKVHGFNLAGGKIYFEEHEDLSKTEKALSDSQDKTYTDNASLEAVSGQENIFTFELPNGAKSGEVNITQTVGTENNAVTIKSLNNINNDDAHGSSSGNAIKEAGNYSGCYNRQPNGTNNNRLSDDIVMDVWDFNSAAAMPHDNSAKDITMKINPSNGLIGFAFANGYKRWSMADASKSYVIWNYSNDFMQCVGFEYDSNGNTFGVVAGGESDANNKGGDSSTLVNGSNNLNTADAFALSSSIWGAASGTYLNAANCLRIESTAQIKNNSFSIDKARFVEPSFATHCISKDPAVANSKDQTDLYLAYYDSLNNEIRFRAGRIEDTSSSTVSEFGSFTNDYKRIPNGNGNGGIWPEYYGKYLDKVQIIADGTSNTLGNAGEYLNLGVTSENVVVIIWYDSKNNNLMCSYNIDFKEHEDSINTIVKEEDRTGISKEGWFPAQTILTGAGKYCKLVIDNENNFHIAAYDGINQDLKYVYIPCKTKDELKVPDYNNKKVCTVDSYLSVGKQLTLDVAKDSSGKWIPYIGYYANTPAKPRYAYLADPARFASGQINGVTADNYTGVWECTIVPTISEMSEDSKRRINVGVWKKNTSGEKINSYYTGTLPAGKTLATASSAEATEGKCYGNGTDNAVLAYGVQYSNTADYVETAQMR